MPRLIVEIDLDNAAFADFGREEEVRRLLRSMFAGASLSVGSTGRGLDSNGNTCARWAVLPDQSGDLIASLLLGQR